MFAIPFMEISAEAAEAPLETSPRAFRAFYDDALPRVYGYFLHRCGGSVQLAEDLTQETFVAAVAELNKGRRVVTPIAWIYGIARHKLLDHYRRQERVEREVSVAFGAEEIEDDVVVCDDGGARNRAVSALASGYFEVLHGRSLGTFNPRAKIFYSTTAPAGFKPLEFLSWRGSSPDWERVCRGPNSIVFADARIAGRDARHIRCGNPHGEVWELWIDRETGLLLKLVGQVGGDDFFLGGADPGTSAKGGFEIEKLRYTPTFPGGTFSVPPGAFDAATKLEAIIAKLPPFRAVIVTHRHLPRGSITYVDEVWWLNEHTWRSKTLLAAHRGCCGPDYASGFSVSAHGTTTEYDAHGKTFFRYSSPGDDNPSGLLAYLHGPGYSPARCPIVGHARIDGRETDHRRCARTVAEATPHHKTWTTGEYWIDVATGLTLRSQVNGHDVLRVRSIQYRPHFPPGIFRFVRPPGSHDLGCEPTC